MIERLKQYGRGGFYYHRFNFVSAYVYRFLGSRLDRVEYTSASQMLIVLSELGMFGRESIFGDSTLQIVNTE